MTASLETLVVASYLFADEMAISRPGPAGETTDAELVALAVAQAAMGVPSAVMSARVFSDCSS